jgi:signal transduction histidine kinase
MLQNGHNSPDEDRQTVAMSVRRPVPPRFFWQGALIVLPALLLAAAGLHSLRQDQLLAEHEAAREARRLATAISEVRLPTELFSRFPQPNAFMPGHATPGGLLDESINSHDASTSREPRFLLFLSPADALVYPPPIAPRPPPVDLDPAALTPAQRAAWDQWGERMSVPDPPAAAAAIAQLISAKMPERWIANTRFRSAVSARDAGDVTRAAALFQTVIAAHPTAAGETGMLLSIIAALELARLPNAARPGNLSALCARIVAAPDASTGTILALAAELDSTCAIWPETFEIQTQSRDFYDVLTQAPDATVRFRNRDYFAFARADPAGRWILGMSAESLRAACERAIAGQTLPAHLRGVISIGALASGAPSVPPLARMESTLPSFRGAFPVQVDLFLADPISFYAQQRARTHRIAALIVLSTVAVLAGFFAAWRSFRKQHQLSEMKTNFVSSVSHELRAPIASMRLMAEELEQGAPASAAKLRDYHHFIGQECRRLSALVENVLDFSRREQGRESFEFAPADIAAIAHETISVMGIAARERDIELMLNLKGNGYERKVDGGALQRLLINLLDNAIKHSPPGAAVQTDIEFASDRVIFMVSDRGPGIAADEQPRIFERFYRVGSELRRETAGVGLGLAIVKYIAEAHAGTVRVESKVGCGSRFIVELPGAALPEESIAQQVASI